MANEEHLARLREGVDAWNAWRKDHADIIPDFSGADLSRADLSGAHLGGAHLSEAVLGGADLSRADLSGAHLDWADLRQARLGGARLGEAIFRLADLKWAILMKADLRLADLGGADLSGADLSRADLSGAHLGGAVLIKTSLSEANLPEVKLFETIFANVDLSTTKGLDNCEHWGPSILDYRTLQRSGRLPLTFLRGCGLPDRLIDYLPSLLGDAIEYYSCFISYASKDDAFAQRLHADLQNNGVRCWFAPHDLPTGAKIWDAIDEAIRVRDKVLLILSKRAIASEWVEDEVMKGFAEERRRNQLVLFPVRIDDTVLKTGEAWAVKLRDQRNIRDFRKWKNHDAYQQAFERVLRDLKSVPG
jgi:hypothetical protein